MSLIGLVDWMRECEGFKALVENRSGTGAGGGIRLPQSAHGLAAAALQRELQRPLLVLTPNRKLARRVYSDLVVWNGAEAPVHLFADVEEVPLERAGSDKFDERFRLRALSALHSSEAPPALVASVDALLTPTLGAAKMAAGTRRINKGGTVKVDEFLKWCATAGYRFSSATDTPGQVSQRGFIIDVFPVTGNYPVRIELFGDEVESLREFHPDTQRSKKTIETILIPAADEIILDETERSAAARRIEKLRWEGVRPDEKDHLMEALGAGQDSHLDVCKPLLRGVVEGADLLEHFAEDALMVAVYPDEIDDAAQIAGTRLRQLMRDKHALGDLPDNFPLPRLSWSTVRDKLNNFETFRLLQWGTGSSKFSFSKVPVACTNMEDAAANVAKQHADGSQVVVVSSYSPRLSEMIDRSIRSRFSNKLTSMPKHRKVHLIQDTLYEGFMLQDPGKPDLLVLTDTELLGLVGKRLPAALTRSRRVSRRETHLDELEEGMLLVHSDHGIGRYKGTRIMGEHKGEYLVLEYAEQDVLYLPISQIAKVEIYKNPSGTPPKLMRLGSAEWSNAKRRAIEAVEMLAGELLNTAARRSAGGGIAHDKDHPWQAQMELGFPYEETPDQDRAISEVKADMEDPKPMDRLICGDVGYGKTEVAMRAAFKSVCSGRQVVVLTPTTLLARQHLQTFSERFKPFPMTVRMVSSLLSPAEQRKTVEEANAGKVDVLIGTHRLIQRDVHLPNLGLMIIDEEHRFGVRQKEYLKRMRAQTDIISMSATPIPRSLHMAMSGVRDISRIDTPPAGRLAPRTFVTRFSTQVVREAILRELERDGQVFALHNHVRSLDDFAQELLNAVPEARVGVAHGQMEKARMEQVATAFVNREYDVLVCTTIIEAGIDIPNVNTLLVDHADNFGLSQLYQLRGRIGRSYKRGYAYLMLRNAQVTSVAADRLNAVLDASELGMGLQIALQDLRIRGAGNLLGSSQSGHMEAIGIDLYTRLLKNAIRDLSKEGGARLEEETRHVELDLDVPQSIPLTYIGNLAQRFNVYHRMVHLNSEKAIKDLEAEIKDRYGPLPREVELIFSILRLKLLAADTGVLHVHHRQEESWILLSSPTSSVKLLLEKHLSELGFDVKVGHKRISLFGNYSGIEAVDAITKLVVAIREFGRMIMARFDALSAS